MARIPEHEIERLKAEVSVQRLAEARGIQLHRHGADLIGLCPFHEDHEPSLVITPAKNLWHCLGACRTGGSVIDWVMKAHGVSFRHAVELLRADHPSLAAPGRIVRKATTSAVKLEAPLESGAEIRGRLQRLGILRESGHEHFNGSVVFPVIDLEGNVTQACRHAWDPDDGRWTPAFRAYLLMMFAKFPLSGPMGPRTRRNTWRKDQPSGRPRFR
jgi:hypothetical protein